MEDVAPEVRGCTQLSEISVLRRHRNIEITPCVNCEQERRRKTRGAIAWMSKGKKKDVQSDGKCRNLERGVLLVAIDRLREVSKNEKPAVGESL